jgi:hypothetical protein
MTGVVKALKLIELSHEMSKQLKGLVENRRKAPMPDYEAVLNQLYSTYFCKITNIRKITNYLQYTESTQFF